MNRIFLSTKCLNKFIGARIHANMIHWGVINRNKIEKPFDVL